ncbi:hypothetical protein PIROE2DRAFT_61643 [Piromyces sp. E2]|nr:hypothetical protein PIROE2DRAFT_61643 [Piromyces sp. E2]|eukprot:OUM62813.1 hypothetical protein PIROE2DRAFT_61643 [Piromyces sp. E2]
MSIILNDDAIDAIGTNPINNQPSVSVNDLNSMMMPGSSSSESQTINGTVENNSKGEPSHNLTTTTTTTTTINIDNNNGNGNLSNIDDNPMIDPTININHNNESNIQRVSSNNSGHNTVPIGGSLSTKHKEILQDSYKNISKIYEAPPSYTEQVYLLVDPMDVTYVYQEGIHYAVQSKYGYSGSSIIPNNGIYSVNYDNSAYLNLNGNIDNNTIYISGYVKKTSDSEDCKNVMKFFDNYISQSNSVLNLPKCCDDSNTSHFIKCENGHITEIRIVNSNVKNIAKIIPSNCPLEILDLSVNPIGIIPDDIGKLKKLEILYIGETNLKSLSEQVFNLNLSSSLDISGSPGLSVKVYNFGKKIKDCDLRGTNVICYEPGTCENIIEVPGNNPKYYSNAESVFQNKCESRKSGGNSRSIDEPKSSGGGSNTLLIVIGLILLILLLILCALFFVMKKRRKNDDDESKISSKKEHYFIPPTEFAKNIENNDVKRDDAGVELYSVVNGTYLPKDDYPDVQLEQPKSFDLALDQPDKLDCPTAAVVPVTVPVIHTTDFEDKNEIDIDSVNIIANSNNKNDNINENHIDSNNTADYENNNNNNGDNHDNEDNINEDNNNNGVDNNPNSSIVNTYNNNTTINNGDADITDSRPLSISNNNNDNNNHHSNIIDSRPLSLSNNNNNNPDTSNILPIPEISVSQDNASTNGSVASNGHNTIPITSLNTERNSKSLEALENSMCSANNINEDAPPSYTEQEVGSAVLSPVNIQYPLSPILSPVLTAYGYNNVSNNQIPYSYGSLGRNMNIPSSPLLNSSIMYTGNIYNNMCNNNGGFDNNNNNNNDMYMNMNMNSSFMNTGSTSSNDNYNYIYNTLANNSYSMDSLGRNYGMNTINNSFYNNENVNNNGNINGMIDNMVAEECQSVMSFFDNYMLSSGHELKIPECCVVKDQYHNIKCENGHITEMDLSFNSVGTIPDSISKLKDLEVLYIGQAKITSLSEKVFDLNLKEFGLDGNPNLSTKIYHFGKKVEVCDLRNVNVLCYEPGTCEKLIENDDPLKYYPDAESVISKKCETTRDGKSLVTESKSNATVYIIIGLLVLIAVICALLFYFKKKGRNDETSSNYYLKSPITLNDDKDNKYESFNSPLDTIMTSNNPKDQYGDIKSKQYVSNISGIINPNNVIAPVTASYNMASILLSSPNNYNKYNNYNYNNTAFNVDKNKINNYNYITVDSNKDKNNKYYNIEDDEDEDIVNDNDISNITATTITANNDNTNSINGINSVINTSATEINNSISSSNKNINTTNNFIATSTTYNNINSITANIAATTTATTNNINSITTNATATISNINSITANATATISNINSITAKATATTSNINSITANATATTSNINNINANATAATIATTNDINSINKNVIASSSAANKLAINTNVTTTTTNSVKDSDSVKTTSTSLSKISMSNIRNNSNVNNGCSSSGSSSSTGLRGRTNSNGHSLVPLEKGPSHKRLEALQCGRGKAEIEDAPPSYSEKADDSMVYSPISPVNVSFYSNVSMNGGMSSAANTSMVSNGTTYSGKGSMNSPNTSLINSGTIFSGSNVGMSGGMSNVANTSMISNGTTYSGKGSMNNTNTSLINNSTIYSGNGVNIGTMLYGNGFINSSNFSNNNTFLNSNFINNGSNGNTFNTFNYLSNGYMNNNGFVNNSFVNSLNNYNNNFGNINTNTSNISITTATATNINTNVNNELINSELPTYSTLPRDSDDNIK